MAMRIIRQPDKTDKSPFTPTETTPLGVVGDNDDVDVVKETARIIEPEVPPRWGKTPREQVAKTRAGRPLTPRGQWMLDFMERTGCTRHTARREAELAGYPALSKKVGVRPAKPLGPRKRESSAPIPRKLITIWLPIRVIDYFKEDGRGYQTRIAEALDLFVRSKPQG